MSAAFDRALAFVIAAEGGATITDDPNDPGGTTRYGISQRSYPGVAIKDLTYEQAREIYRLDYWERCHCDEFPAPIAIALMDSAVNQGPTAAVKLLQRSLGVDDDGIVGPETVTAAAKADASEAVTVYVEKRWDHYRNLATATHYLRGWTKRLFRLQAACLRTA